MFFLIFGLCVFLYVLIYLILLCLLDSDVQLAFYSKFGKPIGHLRGKVVFITGASSGIGEHTAVALAKNGVKLVLAARRLAELERVKRRCLDVSNGKLTANDILTIRMDMLELRAHQRHFAHALNHFGHVDVLLNNAGRSQRALWERIDLAVDKELFELNVFAVVNFTRVALRHFATVGTGHVAVTSSVAGLIGVPFSATYTASKHALHGYYNSLRSEKMDSKLNLAVTLLCPGPTFTNYLAECFTEEEGKKYGVDVKVTDKRMSGERCGELCATAIANRLDESWMAIFPLILFTYIAVYSPLLYKCILKMVGVRKLYKFRDSDEIKLTEVQTV